MAICTYYQRGQCRFGDNCKNEHPNSQRDVNRGFGGGGFGGNTNRFNAFDAGGDRYRPGQQQSGGAFGGNRGSNVARFHLSKDDMKLDLTEQRPVYPFSCYGPGRDAPRQLIEGPVEISPEELRTRYYTQRDAGNVAAVQQEEAQLYAKTEEQVKTILNDLDGAIKYIEAGADVHPNRIDIVQGKAPPPSSANAAASSNPFSKPPGNPFGGGAQTQTSAFGQTSTPAFGQATNPLGRPAVPGFGQPSNPGQTTSAFRQPSHPGQTTSAFGQPSALSAGAGFGKPSMPGSGFGQTSVLGGGSAFGKPSMPGGGAASTFGQTSALSQPSAFGQPSVPGQTPAFGQTNTLGQNTGFAKPAFGQSGFGQPSQPGAGASPFGQQAQQANRPSPFGQAQQANQPAPFAQAQQTNQSSPFAQAAQANQSTPFGQQPQQANPFGKPQEQTAPAQPGPFGGASAPQTAAFGQPGLARPSPFATAQNATSSIPAASPFGTTLQTPTAAPSQPANPFGQPQAQQAPAPAPAPAPFAPQTQPAAAPSAGGPSPATATTTAASRDRDNDRYKEGRPEDYEGEQGRKLHEIYQRVAQMGVFDPNEDIPLVPPKCEWIVSL